jgi:hypothetical protein
MASAVPTSPVQRAWLHAKEKAESEQPEVLALTEDSYLVFGAHGDYTVNRDGIALHCTCTAGSHGRPCYHAARVALLPHEVYRRAMVRAAIAQAATLTAKPVANCPGFLREHPAKDGVTCYWCARCDQEVGS